MNTQHHSQQGGDMNNSGDGGPAFPQDPGWGGASTCKGMSLRDYFAAAALQGMLAGIARSCWDDSGVRRLTIAIRPKDLAELAYLYARCLLDERKEKGAE